MTATKWTAADLPDLHGKTIVVTGANSGIGLVAARDMAGHGARVVLAVRDAGKGETARKTIDGEAEVRQLDLADLASVRAFAEAWNGPVDILINNAGVMAPPLERTPDGFELQMGTNHLGHFALTNLLLPQITQRVVTVSSTMHRRGTIDLADLNWQKRRYSPWGAYGQTKLANLLFTSELQRRLDEVESPVVATAAHPGYAATNLQRHGNALMKVAMKVGNTVMAQPDTRGALPTEYAAVEDLPGNTYVGPDGRGESRGFPKVVGRSAEASDAQLARKLWDLSEQLTGVKFPLTKTAG
jgi:NAD(P)-dependent dehydrogenase (short-subunit alcohol dehydrogenase family)